MATLTTKIILRNDTATNWVTHNPTLMAGEIGVENDTNYFKIGDGTRDWVSLPYANKFEGTGNISAHYEVTATESQTDIEAINEGLAAISATPKFDDVAIVKRLISGDKYSRTAYVFDLNDNWIAFDGNYNAENVFFDEDITVTTDVGNIEINPETGSASIPASGRNLKQVFDTIWSKENLAPAVKVPTLTIDFVSQELNGEVGTTFIAPAATAHVTFGSFEYGSKNETGTEFPASAKSDIVFSSLTLGIAPTAEALESTTDKSTIENFSETSASKSVTYSGAAGTYTDLPQTQKFSAKATYGASGRKALTNLGNFVGDDGLPTTTYANATNGIPASTLTASTETFTATGYRAWFAGGHNQKIDVSSLTGSWIRANLENKGKYAPLGTETPTLSITPGPDGDKCVVIAIPGTEKEYLNRAQLNSFAEITINYTKLTVDVPDAAGANPVPYTVYFYQPAALGEDEKHNIYLV